LAVFAHLGDHCGPELLTARRKESRRGPKKDFHSLNLFNPPEETACCIWKPATSI